MLAGNLLYEFGDIWRTVLPDGLTWNNKDYSIVSSTGIANDPKGLVYSRGAEINSQPTNTVEQQLEFFEKLLQLHPESKVNHRTNLHLHVCVPGLAEDLDALKKLLSYANTNQQAIYEVIEPIPVPARTDYDSAEAYKGAVKRYNRRKVSHQYKVAEARVQEALAATTPKEFFDAHSKLQANGKRAYGLTTRAGINLLQLQETNTVEFRHFTNTLSIEELECCFQWVRSFIPAALGYAPISQLLSASSGKFPKFQPYDHNMEIGYGYTNFQHNSRKVVTERLQNLRQNFNLEECRADEIAAWISKNAQELAL